MRHPCLFCLSQSCVALKLDKKGKPFAFCHTCGTRSFIKSRIGLRGYMVLAPKVLALWQRAADATTTLSRADLELDNELNNGFLKTADEVGF